jgi:hypothetical protein
LRSGGWFIRGARVGALAAGAIFVTIFATTLAGCHRRPGTGAPAGGLAVAPPPPPAPARPQHAPIPPRLPVPPLEAGATYAYTAAGDVPRAISQDAARTGGLLDVDLGDGWAPFILQDGGGAAADETSKPNAYRQTFVDLANDRVNPDGGKLHRGEHNHLEVFGIPPTLSVLLARIEEDLSPGRQACYDGLDLGPLQRFTGEVVYLDHDRAKRDYAEALRDADWMRHQAPSPLAPATADPLQALRADPKLRGRVDRYLRGQARLLAVRAAQARLACEGLLRTRFVDGMYDLPTHEALADWEKKNDVFGWGFLGGETLAGLLRPPLAVHFDTFKRILAERVADAAGIVEDGSLLHRKTPPTYRDEAGAEHPVPDLIADHVDALLAALRIATPEQMVAFLRSHGTGGLASLRVALKAPPLPPYYGPEMDLAAEIDRGDVWYDFPYDGHGRPLVQRRDHFPHVTMYVRWNGQKIPLCWWRTTIGSWRSEVQENGRVYMKYKNSDVGRRVWKNIVATPVWIPPDGTPVRDLLTRKVRDRNVGPVTVVNTDVMGPGFQSAYGLVMAIHVDPARGGFDNQIRTHGSVDYTSIARRFSHGCHRLVNNRAVRLFDFVLRHRAFKRIGNVPLKMKKRFSVDNKRYAYELRTRGYYYELLNPVPVEVFEGRVMGQVKKPITAFVRKPGVDYSAPAPSSGDAAASIASPSGGEPSGVSESAGAL